MHVCVWEQVCVLEHEFVSVWSLTAESVPWHAGLLSKGHKFTDLHHCCLFWNKSDHNPSHKALGFCSLPWCEAPDWPLGCRGYIAKVQHPVCVIWSSITLFHNIVLLKRNPMNYISCDERHRYRIENSESKNKTEGERENQRGTGEKTVRQWEREQEE